MDKEELITRYFEGSLSADQLEAMNELLKTDTGFTANFEFQKQVSQTLKQNERKEIKEGFSSIALSRKRASEIHNNQDSNAVKRKNPKVIRMRSFLIAASIAAIISFVSFLLFFNSNTAKPSDLYASNFVPYENVVHPVERGGVEEDDTTKAFYAYENRNYPVALQLFKELAPQEPNSNIHFYQGMTLMQLDEVQTAVPLLEAYIKSNGQLQDRAIWYLSLAHLKLENIEKAKAELNRLVNLGTFKKKEAQHILSALE